MKVLCIGNNAYDITTPVDTFPVENVKYRVHDRIECGGGPASNAAYLLGLWGVETYIAGIVGDDVYGKRIRDEFRCVGVNTDYLELNKNHITTCATIIANTSNGSRTVLSYKPSSMKMTDVDIDINPDIILVDGQEYEMSLKIFEKYPNAIKIIDAGRDRKEIRDLCTKVDYVVCSLEFAELVSGIKYSNDNLKDIFNELNNQFNTNIIVTLESNGCAYMEEEKVKVVPSIKVKAVDSTGAGDIFHGAFTYGIANAWPMDKILKFANVTGALSVTKIGGRYSIFPLKEVEKVYNEVR